MPSDIKALFTFTRALKLLYVEDNEDARTYTLEMLSRFFDDITVACDGAQGLEKFTAGEFDLVLTDLNMPKMHGIEMIEQIKTIDSEIPVFVLSAHNETGYFEKTDKLGVEDYLAKPLALNQLIDAFSKLRDKKVAETRPLQ